MSAKASPKPSSSNGTSRSAISSARTRSSAAVMTDKATVEIPSPVEGEITWLGAKVGDVVAVGSDLVRLKVPGEDAAPAPAEEAREPASGEGPQPRKRRRPRNPRRRRSAGESLEAPRRAPKAASAAARRAAPRAAPSRQIGVRRAARRRLETRWPRPPFACGHGKAGIDLRQVPGTGPGRPHHPRRSRRLLRSGTGVGEAGVPPGEDRRRGHQGRRPSPQDRREDGGRPFAYPAHHLCRGSRRHRARGAARITQQGEARKPAKAHAPSLPDARPGARHRRASQVECALRRRGGRPASACRRSHRHRDADAYRASWCPWCGMRRRSTSGAAQRSSARLSEAAKAGTAHPGRADRLDHHHHLARRSRRRRLDARSSTIPRSRSSASTRSRYGRYGTARRSCRAR